MFAHWRTPFFSPPMVLFSQMNFFCCQSVRFGLCPRWWFIVQSCSSEMVFTFPLLKLLDTVWQVLIVSFFLLLVLPGRELNNFEYSESLSLNAFWWRAASLFSLPGLLFTFPRILLLWSVIVVSWAEWTERYRHSHAEMLHLDWSCWWEKARELLAWLRVVSDCYVCRC